MAFRIIVKDDYTLETPDGKVLGRNYDDKAESISVTVPTAESDSTCYMIIEKTSRVVIDHKLVTNGEVDIEDEMSQYGAVLIGFSFQRTDLSKKNSDFEKFDFAKALNPSSEVPVTPEQQTDLDTLRTNAFADANLKPNDTTIIQFKNVKGVVKKELSLEGAGQVQADWSESDTTKPAFIKNKPTIPTVNDATVTIKQGETTKGTFTLNQSNNATITLDEGGVGDYGDLTNKPKINNVELSGNKSFDDLGLGDLATKDTVDYTTEVTNKPDLTVFSLITETGNKIALSMNSSTYVLTLQLKDKNDNVLSTGTVDLPIESMVIGGSYDNTTKKIILTLKSGSTVEIPVGDLVSGLQTQIQFTTMPTASSSNVGNVVQFIGTTTSSYTHNYWYENVHIQVTESITAEETDSLNTLSDISVNATTFKSKVNGGGTYVFKNIGYPTKLNYSNISAIPIVMYSLTRDSTFDRSAIGSGSAMYSWVDESNNYYVTDTLKPTATTKLYLLDIQTYDTTDTGATYLNSNTPSTTSGYWTLQDGNSYEEVNLADYGITMSSNGFPSNEITVTYVEANDSYEWQQKNVQPAGSLDYDELTDKPIINADLSNLSAASAVVNQTYRHTGTTTSTFTQNKLYASDGTSWSAIGGGSSTLNGLSDVDSSSLYNGDVLKWDSAQSKWKPDSFPTVDQTYNASSTNAQSGTAVASAISTKQDTINSSNKLSADLVDDTNTTNQFVTSSEKTTWNSKSVVSVSDTGTATDEVQYITINGTEKKLAGGSSITVEDNLTSTSTTNALSANQGRVLNETKSPRGIARL